MKTLTALCLLLSLWLLSCSQPAEPSVEETRPFPHLTELPIDERISLYYNPETATVFNEKSDAFLANHPEYASMEFDCEAGSTVLVATTINQQEYLVYFGACPSPDFYFVKKGSTNLADFTICANNLYLPGNQFIYTDGYMYEEFNKRRKYVLEGEAIKEITQPYYYVGLKSTTLRPLTLYQETSLTTPVAQLPKDYTVEVLLADPDNPGLYLVKTAFGLVGWTPLEAGQYQSIDVEGLEYWGD